MSSPILRVTSQPKRHSLNIVVVKFRFPLSQGSDNHNCILIRIFQYRKKFFRCRLELGNECPVNGLSYVRPNQRNYFERRCKKYHRRLSCLMCRLSFPSQTLRHRHFAMSCPFHIVCRYCSRAYSRVHIERCRLHERSCPERVNLIQMINKLHLKNDLLLFCFCKLFCYFAILKCIMVFRIQLWLVLSEVI